MRLRLMDTGQAGKTNGTDGTDGIWMETLG